MSVQTYVSSDGERGFAPLIDMAMDLVARDSRWRRALADQIAPASRDVILDIGCGDGALAMLLAESARGASIIGIDSNEAAIARARTRAIAVTGAQISFMQGSWRDAADVSPRATPTKVIVSLVEPDMQAATKREILIAARAALRTGGALHVADYTARRTALMQRLFQAVRAPEGAENLEASGALIGAIHACGFEAVEETARIPTASGSISLYRARAA